MCVQQALIFWKEKCCWRCCCYFHNGWNWVLTIMLIGFLASELLWFIGGWPVDKLESASDVPEHRILLLANSLFSISTVISVFYLGSFWTVHSMGGPLQISSLRMLKDIRNFSVIFFGVFMAFTLGVWNIYSFRNTLEAIYPKGNGTAQHVEGNISTYVFGNIIARIVLFRTSVQFAPKDITYSILFITI